MSAPGNMSSYSQCVVWFCSPEQVVWYSSIVTQTLDTVSVIVTQYNNTAFTSITTVRHDLPIDYGALSKSQPPGYTDPQYILSIMGEDYTFNVPYDPMWQAVNLTDGQLDSSTSIPYPSAYIAATAIGYAALNGLNSECSPPAGFPGLQCPEPATLTTVSGAQCTYTTNMYRLPDTYYEMIPMAAFATPAEFGALSDTRSAAAWLQTNSYLTSLVPNINRCVIVGELAGPPRVKIPVDAMTGTVTTTLQSTGMPTSQIPMPVSPLTTSTAASTVPPSPQPSAPRSDSQLPSPKTSQPSVSTPNSVSISNSPASLGGSRFPEPLPNTIPEATPAPEPSYAHDPQPKPEQAPEPSVTNTRTSVSSVPLIDVAQMPPEHMSSEAMDSAPVGSRRPAISFGGTRFTQDTNSRIVLPAGTLTPGGELTLSGTPIFLAPGGSYVIVGTSTQQVAFVTLSTITANPSKTAAHDAYTAGIDGQRSTGKQIPTEGGEVLVSDTPVSVNLGGGYASPIKVALSSATYTANAAGDFVIASQTLKPGNALTIDGNRVSYANDGDAVVIGSTTQFLASSATHSISTMTFDGSPHMTNSDGDVVIAGQTIKPGEALTLSGTPVSFAADHNAVVIGSTTESLVKTDTPNAPIITFGGSQYTANLGGDFVIGSQTLRPGEALTLAGTPISYAPDHAFLVIGSSTQSLSPSETFSMPILTFGGTSYTANADGEFLINGQTLAAGGTITVSGTPIIYGPTSGKVITASKTQHLAHSVTNSLMVYAGSTFTENAAGNFIIASQTLSPGEVITVSGTPISYAADKTAVVVPTSTEAVATGLGGYIVSAFGSGPAPDPGSTTTASTTGGVAAFTGEGSRLGKERSMWVLGVGVLIAIAMAVLR